MTNHRELSVHKEHELLGALEKAGLSEDEAQRVIESRDNLLAQRVVSFIGHNGYRITTSMKMARTIMGHNFIGLGALKKHFGIDLTEEEFTDICEVPFTEEILEECKDTHILFPGFPLSIESIWKMHPELFRSPLNPWFKSRLCGSETVHSRWYLIRKESTPETKGLDFQHQSFYIREGKEEIPRVCELAFGIILFYLEKDIRLFKNEAVRCADIPEEMYHVFVENFRKPEGLWVSASLDAQPDHRHGLASSHLVSSID